MRLGSKPIIQKWSDVSVITNCNISSSPLSGRPYEALLPSVGSIEGYAPEYMEMSKCSWYLISNPFGTDYPNADQELYRKLGSSRSTPVAFVAMLASIRSAPEHLLRRVLQALSTRLLLCPHTTMSRNRSAAVCALLQRGGVRILDNAVHRIC